MLKLWARNVLAIPATGSPIERQFSISGRVATWTRARLSPAAVGDTMMYKAYLKWSKIDKKRKSQELKLEDASDDLPVVETKDGIPEEWADRWWVDKEKVMTYMTPKIRDRFAKLIKESN